MWSEKLSKKNVFKDNNRQHGVLISLQASKIPLSKKQWQQMAENLEIIVAVIAS